MNAESEGKLGVTLGVVEWKAEFFEDAEKAEEFAKRTDIILYSDSVGRTVLDNSSVADYEQWVIFWREKEERHEQ